MLPTNRWVTFRKLSVKGIEEAVQLEFETKPAKKVAAQRVAQIKSSASFVAASLLDDGSSLVSIEEPLSESESELDESSLSSRLRSMALTRDPTAVLRLRR